MEWREAPKPAPKGYGCGLERAWRTPMWKRSRWVLVLAGGAAAVLAAAALAPPRDLILYNHSPSIPEGLYVRTDAPPIVGAFVTVRARDVAPEEARQRHYDDVSDRFIKRVAAGPGARVCGDGERLVVTGDNILVVGADAGEQQHNVAGAGGDVGAGDDDGGAYRAAAAVRVFSAGGADGADQDGDGRRRLVGWQGCRTLGADEVLLLGDTADSFDGRYWGPINARLIEGVWRRL